MFEKNHETLELLDIPVNLIDLTCDLPTSNDLLGTVT